MRISKKNKNRIILSSIIIFIGLSLIFVPARKIEKPGPETTLKLTSNYIHQTFTFQFRSFDHELKISISDINSSVRIIVLNASEEINYLNNLTFTSYYDEIVATPLVKSISLYPLDFTESGGLTTYVTIMILKVGLDTDTELTLDISCSYHHFPYQNYGILFIVIGAVLLVITIKKSNQSIKLTQNQE